MRVAYQKSEDKNHGSLYYGWRSDNHYSKSALQVYMTMYSISFIEAHPTTISRLSGRFPNSKLG